MTFLASLLIASLLSSHCLSPLHSPPVCMNSSDPQSPSWTDPLTSTQTDRAASPSKNRCVLVCQHRTCIRHGAAGVMAAFQAVSVPGVRIRASDCLGQCSIGPNVQVLPDEIWYARLTPEDVTVIAEQHLQGGQPVDRLLNPRIHLQFYGV
ncbi:(2Fe-2S) ferredoxin domain-containing protein [Trichothermofontia sp.]